MNNSVNIETTCFSWLDNDYRKNTKLPVPKYDNTIMLALFTKWNDYGLTNTFYVFYFKERFGEKKYIGTLKIINSEYTQEGNFAINLDNIIQDSLEDKYASLGDDEYYANLLELFPDDCVEILKRVNDITQDNERDDRFKNNIYYSKSLMRENAYEQMYRLANDIVQKKDYTIYHRFIYQYAGKELNFDFNVNNEYFPKNIITIIGKNGAGKSTLLSDILQNIHSNCQYVFKTNVPKFKLLLFVSTSVHDKFNLNGNSEINKYKYCGPFDEQGEFKQEDDIIKELINDCVYFNDLSKSTKSDLPKTTKKSLSEMFAPSIIQQLYRDDKNTYIDSSSLTDLYKNLSSGEKSLLYCIMSIIANIKYNSLLFLDEPELHLHPNTIASFMHALSELLKSQKSSAIVVTHSPVILRELKADSIYIQERINNYISFRKPSIETLGEDLSEITDEVFQTREISKHYIDIIDKLSETVSKEEAIEILKSDGYTGLSLPISLYLEKVYYNK